MTVRVTSAEVKAILPDSELTNTVIDTYITSANVLVSSVLGTSGLGADLLKEIERWMTAHLIASSRERMAETEEAGGAKIKYTGKSGLGLSGTPYGQQVLVLDTSGSMAKLGEKSASFIAVRSFDP